ncbi:hypothetical protein [Endozoicomonas sp. SCSIO W0465]|uniref:hypothetical protein n=1 Tax=Endozoicomonas sp. SCSIO W0465 TaxID=2918516 RepID=UPI0020763713|nr:hypothetical protein [Endozoicomonas sp. SCSIO W0465]USE34107.1 hypothetical protein MJO57_18260 [Endozoicomonas sp. SCSIO W0465]
MVKSDDEVTITAKKMKDADEPDPIKFLFNPVRLPFTDDDGEPQYSCVLQNLDSEVAQQLLATKQVGEAQKAILRVLESMIAEARETLKSQSRDPDKALIEARQLRKKCIDGATVTAKNWSRTFSGLVEKNLLIQDGVHITLSDFAKEAIQ